jgi:hypothetical protein
MNLYKHITTNQCLINRHYSKLFSCYWLRMVILHVNLQIGLYVRPFQVSLKVDPVRYKVCGCSFDRFSGDHWNNIRLVRLIILCADWL